MDKLETFAEGYQVGAVMLNTLQELAAAARAASHGDLTGMKKGAELRVFQASADVTTGTLVTVCDKIVDVVDTLSDPLVLTTGTGSAWTDRVFWGVVRTFAGAGQLPGGTNDHTFDAAGAPSTFLGYSGLGALDAGGVNPPSAGNPPVPAMGTSWAMEIKFNLWLYVDPSDGALKLYNATGSTIRTPMIVFIAFAGCAKRP